MPVRRHLTALSVVHAPGDRDQPPTRDRAVENELRKLQRQRDIQARRTNAAYGTLNLDDWSENVTRSARAVPPPRGPYKGREKYTRQ